MSEKLKGSNHQPDGISEKCSCLNCDSLSCFAKRNIYHQCACQICSKPKKNLNNDQREGLRNKITLPYLNAPRPRANKEIEELTEDEINYECERKTLLETNQLPPHSLDEYLDRLCVSKASSKFKQKPTSLSGYIDIISQNAEYKRKLNALKRYIQSLKQAKPPYRSEDLFNSETYMESLQPQQWYNRLSEISYQPKNESNGICHHKCLVKQEPNCQKVTQIQSAMMSYPIMNYYKHESARLNTQGSNDVNETCNDSYKTSTSNENISFRYNILKKLKEACVACSCKVCECIIPKFNNYDICKCTPCQCTECKDYTATQSISRGSHLSPTLSFSCSVHDDQREVNQQDCSCEPCECEICYKNNSSKYSDVRKPLITRQPLQHKVTRTSCACSACNCCQCLQTFSDDKYKENSKTEFNCPKVNDIYLHGDNNNQNIQQNFVALYTGMPPTNTNRGYETKVSRSCICKECECITCICKENTINAIKSSGFFSTVDESNHLLKSSSGNNHYCENRPYKVCKACSHQKDRLIDKCHKHPSCCMCDECNRLNGCSSNPKTHLNRCRCTNCRCERCIAHGFTSKYSNRVGAFSIKKGDVLSPSAHQIRVNKINLEEKTTPTTLFHKYKPVCIHENSYINPHKEDMNYRSSSKNMCPKNVTSRPSVSRQAKCDMGTMLTKSFNRWNILKCDAYVHSQEFNKTRPLQKNNFTTSRSRSIIHSITGSPSQENDNRVSINENKTESSKTSCNISCHDHSDYLIPFPKIEVNKMEYDSKLDVPNDLKNNTSTTQPSIQNVISEKKDNIQSPLDILTEVSTSRVNESEKLQILTGEIRKSKTHSSFLQRTDNIFTKITSSNIDNESENKIFSYSHAQVQPKESKKIAAKTNACLVNVISSNEIVSVSSQPMKSLSTSAVATIERLIFFSSEQMSNNKSIKSSTDNSYNYKCFRMLQNLKQCNLIDNIYNHYKSPKLKIDDLLSPIDVSVIKNNNEKARKTLEDAKNFSLDLLSLLDMYEKANNEFVKVSENLRLSYISVLDRNINKLGKFNVKKHSTLNSSLEEITIPNLITNDVSKYKHGSFEDIIEKRFNDCPMTTKREMSHMNKITSNQESSNTDSELFDAINKNNKTESKEKVHKKYDSICYADVQSDRSKRSFKNKIKPEYDGILTTNESGAVAEMIRHADLKRDVFVPFIKSVEHLSTSTSTDTTNRYQFSPTLNIREEIGTETGPVYTSNFSVTAKPTVENKGTGISEIPSSEKDTKETILSFSVNKTPTNVTKIEKKRNQNKALSLLQLEISKLLQLAIMEPLTDTEDTEDILLDSSSIFDQSILNLDIKEQPKLNKSINQQPEYVDKEVWCNDEKLLDEFKRQIREELKVAYMHPLMNKESSLGSYSGNSESEELKARFQVVRKISEHTALLRWSRPRELDVHGYELLVDGCTVQKILNPSKCTTAVTCLPHTDKILLTIRTITSVLPEVGRYPTATMVYRPHQQ